MKKMFMAIVIFAVVTLGSLDAAAWTVDILPAYSSGNPWIVESGDEVTYELWFNPDTEGNLLTTSYYFRIDYDNNELNYVSGNEYLIDAGWVSMGGIEDIGFQVYGGPVTFGDGSTISSPFKLYDFTFEATLPVYDNLPELTYNGTNSGEGFFVDGTWYSAPDIVANHHNSEGQDIAPIPEPTSLLLLGSGFLGLFGFRRRS